MKHYGFPHIDQFRDVVKEVQFHSTYTGKDEKGEPIYDTSLPKPTVLFKGTTKLHGTNASLVLLKDDSIQYQSRESILKSGIDNSGFYHLMNPLEKEIRTWIKGHGIPFNEYIAIYGEWCGKGIEKGTGVSQLEKMFVVFACRVDDVWINSDIIHVSPLLRIYNINSYTTHLIDIDFNNPADSLERLNEFTIEIGNSCPVAKSFGIDGIGEGIVWVGSITRPTHNSPMETFWYRFKTKSKEYFLKAKAKESVTLDVDKYNSVVEFVADNLSNNRLEQGLSWLKTNNLPVEIGSIVPYLRWCVDDVTRECKEEIEISNLDGKMLNKELGKVARKFYLEYLNTHL